MPEYDGQMLRADARVCGQCGSRDFGKSQGAWICFDCDAAADTKRELTTTLWEWLRYVESDDRDEDEAS